MPDNRVIWHDVWHVSCHFPGVTEFPAEIQRRQANHFKFIQIFQLERFGPIIGKHVPGGKSTIGPTFSFGPVGGAIFSTIFL
jgi:hypothetical protein